MLPQTNLQLYHALTNCGYGETTLAHVRAAYDLSRQLFAGCYRPSHKSFDAHLVGSAGALALWRQPEPVIVAGLLHSAYLYGNFGDGARGATPERRKAVQRLVGEDAEEIIAAYTAKRWPESIRELKRQYDAKEVSQSLVAVKLADLCDESVDGGWRFAPAKPLGFKLDEIDSRPAFLKFVDQVVGAAASEFFAAVLTASDQINPTAPLVNADRSFHAVNPGVEGLRRSRIRAKMERLTKRLAGKRAA